MAFGIIVNYINDKSLYTKLVNQIGKMMFFNFEELT